MKITSIEAREIFDSRGMPTVECEMILNGEISVLASVPSGASVGSHEAVELRDGGKRLMGKGVSKAITTIETKIAPLILNQEPDVLEFDRLMIEIDGTERKENLGANAMLAVSIATIRAQAVASGYQLYELIALLTASESVSMPFPLFNIINGGAHADNTIRIQEFMIMPVSGQHFRQAIETAVVISHTVKDMLKAQGKRICVGDEGGFAPDFADATEVLQLLTDAIEKISSVDDFRIGLDIAATRIYDPKKKTYDWYGKQYNSEDLIALYKKLSDTYPIFSIEDGLAEDDWDGWKMMTKELGGSMQLVGDDLFVTSCPRIAHGVEQGIANAVIIKPNQIGTVTETLQAIEYAQENNMSVIVSHRSGETEDTFIADLAVGSSASQIKAGGCTRSERLAKYNRLLRIEDELMFRMID